MNENLRYCETVHKYYNEINNEELLHIDLKIAVP